MTRRSEATRRRLLAAARELIASEGLDISLSEVAERAGVTRMTLYRHFGPRRELLLEVLVDDLAPLATTASAVLADTSLPLADRAHLTMCHATVSLASTPLLVAVLGDGHGIELTNLDPSDVIGGLLATATTPFLMEADAAGMLRATPAEALVWIGRQLIAAVVARQSAPDPMAVAREVGLFYIPSLLRVSDAECERLARTDPLARPLPAAT